jgi:hypothetical protein
VIDVLLSSWVREGETEGQLGQVLVLVMELDELLQAVGDVLPQLLSSTGTELFRHLIFRLGNIEGALLVGQGDLANTQVGAAHVEGKVGTLFVSIGETHDPGNIHGLNTWLVKVWDVLGSAVSHNVAALDRETYDVVSFEAEPAGAGSGRTLLKLTNEVLHDLLELGSVDSEDLLELLDMLQKILRQLVHRS